MQETLIIVNPAAGKGRGAKAYKKLLQIKNISEKAVIKKTNAPKHATKIARNYSANYKKIIIAGGDGTVNEVINGLHVNSKNEICIVPIGTGNDFARNFCGKFKNIAQIPTILNGSTDYKLSKFGLYQVDYRVQNEADIKKTRFINALGAGFDALVAKIVNENKKLSGVAAYVLGVFKALKVFDFVDVKYSVPNFQLIDKKNLLITIGSGKTSGGGFYLSPHANVKENYLAVTFISKMSKFKIILSLPFALINKINKVKEVQLFKADSVEFSFNNPIVAHCDGEILSDKITYFKIKRIEHNLKFIVF